MLRLFFWWRQWSAPDTATVSPVASATVRVFCTGRWYGTIVVSS